MSSQNFDPLTSFQGSFEANRGFVERSQKRFDNDSNTRSPRSKGKGVECDEKYPVNLSQVSDLNNTLSYSLNSDNLLLF
jgi:hypothetical protein